jgi:hypothetical protein
MDLLLLAIENGQLIVQGPEVIDVTNEKKTSGEEVEDHLAVRVAFQVSHFISS